jgi:hypothetical protein
MDCREKFVVEPGKKVRLSDINPSFSGKHESHEEALPEIQKHVQRMAELQYLLYADGAQSLLIVLQALDELCWIFGDGVNQAADFFSDATSIPSRNVTPLTTFGN